MIDLIKETILDFQELVLETGTPRRVEIKQVAGKATVCIGARRSGKSTFMFQRIQDLIKNGVSRQNIFYLNFFDDRLHGLKNEPLGIILEAYYSLFPEKKNTERIYCFFDEIQVISGWEPFIDRLIRMEKCEVFITGSSADMLSREIATQMRGRALSWEMFPFSFREFLDFKGIESTPPLSTKKRLIIQKAFEAYWLKGGFPEVAGLDRPLRIKIHQEYFNTMLFRDIVERHDISHPRAVADLAHFLMDNIASFYSINRLSGYLKTLGHKAPKASISDYMAWFEDAYIFFTVRIFDASLKRANTNPKKVYCVDHSFVTSVSSGILINTGHLLENLVFIGLRRITSEIFYFKSKSGREVDFILLKQDRSKMLIQVSESIVVPETRKREITALTDAMAELKINDGTIVTRSEEEIIQTDAGQINVIPVWRFLLHTGVAETTLKYSESMDQKI